MDGQNSFRRPHFFGALLAKEAAIAVRKLTAIQLQQQPFRHLCRALEVKLIGLELHAVRIAHRFASLDTQQDFLRVRVFVMQIVTIVGRHQRNACLFRKPHQVRVDFLLDFQSLVLNLQKEILLAENISQPVCVLARLIIFFIHNGFSYRTL